MGWRGRGARVEREIAIEIESHVESYAADLVSRGVAPEEARRRAALEFGSRAAVEQECREAVGLRWPDEMARDVRYAARVLRKSPAFTAAVVATLALCIGANTAIFSVVDAVLLRPLPYPQPERLVTVARSYQGRGDSSLETSQTGRTWEAIRDDAGSLDAAAYSWGVNTVNFSGAGSVESVRQERVSAGFFGVLGIAPLLGHEFTRLEDVKGGPPVAVLSYSLWRHALGGDPAAMGRTIMLRGEPHTVVGVMPAGFQSSSRADLWTPLRPTRDGEGNGSNYHIVARLKPGVAWTQAATQVQAIGTSLFAGQHLPAGTSLTLRMIALQRGWTERLRTPLNMLWGAVGLVLLIGCVNIAGLLLARAAGRTRELATRLALGSGRAALVRQLLAESILLAVAGGAAGVLLGWCAVGGLKTLAADSLNLWQSIELSWRVLAVTAGVSIVAGILFGVYPALAASRLEIRAALGEAGRGVAGARNPWPRRFLVAGEVALGVVLLVGAGLLIRTFAHLNGLDPGFDARHVLTAQLSLQDVRYATAASVNRLYTEGLDHMRELPGVESAAVALTLPYEQALNVGFREVEGRHGEAPWQTANMFYITPEYFRVLRIPLLRGRFFNAADSSSTARVVIVSQSFARTYLGGGDAVGHHLAFGDHDTRQIVGVVGDVQQKSGWGEDFGPVSPAPAVFLPVAQTDDAFLQMVHTWFTPSWLVRTEGQPEKLIPGMQRALASVDPQLPFAGFHSMQSVRYRSLAEERLEAALMTALAALALLLAAVGIYGLIAHSVVERRREMGIRLALGATVAQAIRAVALPGVTLALAGVAAGTVLASFAAAWLRHLLWGVRPGDPSTFLIVAVVLLSVACAASLIPALRVTRLHPAETLRQE